MNDEQYAYFKVDFKSPNILSIDDDEWEDLEEDTHSDEDDDNYGNDDEDGGGDGGVGGLCHGGTPEGPM